MSLKALSVQEISAGLKELGRKGFSISGDVITGVADMPTDAEIIAAATLRKSKREDVDAVTVDREAAIEAMLTFVSKMPSAPKELTDYIAARDG